jgi:hypothetical protein
MSIFLITVVPFSGSVAIKLFLGMQKKIYRNYLSEMPKFVQIRREGKIQKLVKTQELLASTNQSWHFYSGILLGFFFGGTGSHLGIPLLVLPVPLIC